MYFGHKIKNFIKPSTSFNYRSSQFVNNPHIRAMLAQLLSLMIPHEDDDDRGLVPGVSHKLKISAAFLNLI